jgi:hypothetical protein
MISLAVMRTVPRGEVVPPPWRPRAPAPPSRLPSLRREVAWQARHGRDQPARRAGEKANAQSFLELVDVAPDGRLRQARHPGRRRQAAAPLHFQE